MSSSSDADDQSSTKRSAEDGFREAFERLKAGRPLILERGASVSQNNVAKEAGRDPSALRKARYPLLVGEIQAWLTTCASNGVPDRFDAHTAKTRRLERRTQKQQIADITAQRDRLASLLVEADAKILDLTNQLAELTNPSNVVPIRRPGM